MSNERPAISLTEARLRFPKHTWVTWAGASRPCIVVDHREDRPGHSMVIVKDETNGSVVAKATHRLRLVNGAGQTKTPRQTSVEPPEDTPPSDAEA